MFFHNITVLIFKLRTYFLKKKYFHNNGFGVKKPTKVDMP